MATDPDLFDVKRRKARKQTDPAPSGAVQHLIGVYRTAYESRYGELPVITKKDGALLKGLVQTFGAPKVEARLKAFMVWEDKFIDEQGYTVGVFHQQWNRLTAQVQKSDRTRNRPGAVPDVNETQAYLKQLHQKK